MNRANHGSPLRLTLLLMSLLSGPLGAIATAQVVSVPGNYSTIQAAINGVASGTTINVQPGTYHEALVVNIQNKSITVRGVGGASATIVDAAGRNTTAIHVLNSTGAIVFDGLTFRNGAMQGSLPGGAFLIQNASPTFANCVFENSTAFDGGGGALSNSNATFTGCAIRGNQAQRFGGGLYIVSGSRPQFIACDILNNQSGTGGAGVANNGAGGGVFSHDSSPIFRGGRISNNSSKFAAGGIFHLGIYGSSFGTAAMTIEDATIADNVSTPFSAAENPAEGGGMHVEDNATVSLTRVQVLRNRANTGGGLNAYRGRYDIVDSTIEGNIAAPTAAVGTGFGGGICTTANNDSTPLRAATVVNLTRTLVRGNTATSSAGGVGVFGDVYNPSVRASLTIVDSVITGNNSQSQGGGVLASRTNAEISGSIISLNTVTGGSNANGGGMQFLYGDVNITGTTVAGNTAGQYGGGVFINEGVSLTITGSRLYDNAAGINGGGGLFVGGGAVSGTVQSSIIADNTQYQVVEHKSGASSSFLTYNSNTITPRPGSSDFYMNFSNQDNTITAFNNNRSNTSGNNANAPQFAHLLAAPRSGTRFTLAWSAGRATSVTISGVGSFNTDNGTTDVTPGGSTSYTMTSAGNPTVSTSVTYVAPPSSVPQPRRSVPSDFDGDGRSDLTVFRPGNGTWYIRYAATGATAGLQWGSQNDVPVAGDYDGDGRADAAVFRPSNGTWYLRYTATGAAAGVQFGVSSDVAVPADYDGDGKTDIAVFRRSTGTWYLRYSSTGGSVGVQWGVSSDVPVPADYDGDGKADVAVFRPSTGTWYIRYAATGATAGFQWGGSSDVPVAADYDGDGRADLAVFRSNGTWYFWYSSTNAGASAQWGVSTDRPMPGDYDGDGRGDPGLFRPGNATWYLWYTSGSTAGFQWGNGNDVPIPRRP